MKFRHRDGASASAGSISLGATRDKAKLDADGVFEIDDDREDRDELVERLVDAGHQPLEGDAGSEDKDGSATETPRASDFTEEDLVDMGYRDMQTVATGYDDVDGSASADALTEALIEKRREEVGE